MSVVIVAVVMGGVVVMGGRGMVVPAACSLSAISPIETSTTLSPTVASSSSTVLCRDDQRGGGRPVVLGTVFTAFTLGGLDRLGLSMGAAGGASAKISGSFRLSRKSLFLLILL